MVRPPCCEKMGVKKGPWTPEEDRILVSYIQRYGHENWRALPKQAGLLRCGKSCRLRWINYLRPDIKRGNFSEEEEETIIKLHEMLGNRWSAIASRLSGRTDNEIKNYWNTQLRKRVKKNQPAKKHSGSSMITDKWRRHYGNDSVPELPSNHLTQNASTEAISNNKFLNRPEFCSNKKDSQVLNMGVTEEIQYKSFSYDAPSKIQGDENSRLVFQSLNGFANDSGSNTSNDMYFWYNVFINAGKG